MSWCGQWAVAMDLLYANGVHSTIGSKLREKHILNANKSALRLIYNRLMEMNCSYKRWNNSFYYNINWFVIYLSNIHCNWTESVCLISIHSRYALSHKRSMYRYILFIKLSAGFELQRAACWGRSAGENKWNVCQVRFSGWLFHHPALFDSLKWFNKAERKVRKPICRQDRPRPIQEGVNQTHSDWLVTVAM